MDKFYLESLKNLFSSIPVGLVNALKPLGHSGHLKLHEVVGSKDMLAGYPHCTDFFVTLDQ